MIMLGTALSPWATVETLEDEFHLTILNPVAGLALYVELIEPTPLDDTVEDPASHTHPMKVSPLSFPAPPVPRVKESVPNAVTTLVSLSFALSVLLNKRLPVPRITSSKLWLPETLRGFSHTKSGLHTVDIDCAEPVPV